MKARRQPLVSIITPTYQRDRFLEATILSVLGQSYPNVEYIVIDGGSGENVLTILRTYEEQLRWISEPEAGQVDAINKGFQMASGEILAFINSDDLYTPQAVAEAVLFFQQNPDALIVYGDASAIDEKDRSYGIRQHVRPCTLQDLVTAANFIVQPTAFWRASLWQELGEFDTSFPHVFDYEWWMRASQRHTLHYVQSCWARERHYAATKTSLGGVKRFMELDRLGRRYGGSGIARNYRPEGAATYIHAGLVSLLGGQWKLGWEHIRTGTKINNSLLKLFIYLMPMILLGPGSVPKLRLYSNRIRQGMKKQFDGRAQ